MAMKDKGQIQGIQKDRVGGNGTTNDLFVLDSSIFLNVFKRDIRRVYLYKKTERLAKAVTLISPAFSKSIPLKNRFDLIAIALIDAATLTPSVAKEELSKELLALSSLLSIARSSGALSHMNIDLITNEAHTLLSEIAEYEEPRFTLEDSFSLAELLSESEKEAGAAIRVEKRQIINPSPFLKRTFVQDTPKSKEVSKRQDSILSIIKDRKEVYIKDISTTLREYSEKTIQRELSAMVLSGVLEKKGDKRWTTYKLKD